MHKSVKIGKATLLKFSSLALTLHNVFDVCPAQCVPSDNDQFSLDSSKRMNIGATKSYTYCIILNCQPGYRGRALSSSRLISHVMT